MQLNVQRLLHVDVRGLEHLQGALQKQHGVLITPNHSGHADAFILYHAADKLRQPFYFMTAWQVLGLVNFMRRTFLRKHGCFSVDREGTDLQAFRQAVDILQSRPDPLVIFPEGEVYHINERVTPFREGPATIAILAAKRAKRPIVCIPCGIRYYYVEDPTSELHSVMERLEQEMFWRPSPQLPLERRIYRLAEGLLALKELEYLDCTCSGALPDRVALLSDSILTQIEERHRIDSPSATIPERVKSLRQQAIKKLETFPDDDPGRRTYEHDLDDLFFVTQLFSYPGDYVAEKPSIERMAETLDKFEEDVLGASTAAIRGARHATVTFGEPIHVDTSQKKSEAATTLTQKLEEQVQTILDQTPAPSGRTFG